ncbi:MAG: transposase [Candidatus Nomurabacteria bacterium]|nr:transposase [Candidatus Nomurabacteria bacterium]
MQKQVVFHDDNDRLRFLFLILTFQGLDKIDNIGRKIKSSVQHGMLNVDTLLVEKIIKNRMVELINFTFMPNHFHLIVRTKIDGGVTKYMQRVLNAYTKYFNIKYSKSGYLFQGPYKAVHIEDDEQLMYTSAYNHKNPIELEDWKNCLDKYPWSSYQDCLYCNRWEKLLVVDPIIDRFTTRLEYKEFVESSTAKESYY